MLKTRPFTITRHDDKSKIVNDTTTEDRFFKIEHVKNIPESGSNNYYEIFHLKVMGNLIHVFLNTRLL